MGRGKRTVRASEIGNYLYCERAWWYARQGVRSRNKSELAGGAAYHDEHAGKARRIIFTQVLAYFLLAAAILLIIITLVNSLTP